MVGKRKGISLKDKYMMVIRIRDGEAQTDVARKLGLRKSTVSGIWKKRDLIMKAYEGLSHSTKRLRHTSSENIDKRLYTWYRARINAKLQVSGLLLKEKAEEIALSLGEDFKCSSNWIDRFKNRHGILFKCKTNDTDQESFKHNFWPYVRSGYSDENIFTVREAGIFFKSFPDDKLDLCCDKGELASYRLTLVICANMTGLEKRPLLIVGNKPCNVKLPVKYRYNRKCWMNLALSLEQLSIWNEELASCNRKVVLLVKFSPAFRSLTDLSHIKIGFYTEDITAHPLDPAMVELKYFYRKYLLNYDITKNSINRLQSIRFIYKSWLRVCAETISDGFQILNGPYEHKKLSLIPWAKKKGKKVSKNLDDCLYFDDELVTSVHFLSDAANIGEPLDCVNANESGDDISEEGMSYECALKMAQSLSKFIEDKGDKTIIECILKVEHFIEDTLESSVNMQQENLIKKD